MLSPPYTLALKPLKIIKRLTGVETEVVYVKAEDKP